MAFIKNIPKVYLFISMTVISAVIFRYSEYGYIITGSIILLLFIKPFYNILCIFLFIIIHFISSSFFIAVNVETYNNKTVIYAGSGQVTIDKKIDIPLGSIITGKFHKDNSKSMPFFKPYYKVQNNSIKIIQIPFISNILKFRKNISSHIFYATGGQVATAQALILGDRSFIQDDLKDAYTISGLSHLLAMSGTHAGIITAIIFAILFFMPLKIRLFFAMIFSLFLILLGGFNITIIRATLFASIIMTAYIFDIKVNMKLFIFAVMGFFILISPYTVTDISFLMSFGAVFGIIYLLDKGHSFITSAILTGIAATLITAPLSMYVFGTTNHLSIISTIFMAPLISLHILFALFTLIAGDIGLAPLIIIEKLSNNAVYILKDITFFGFILKHIPLWLMISSIIFVIICLFLKGRLKFLSLIALFVIFYPAEKPVDMVFPYLEGKNKGFIIFHDNKKEIFYQGSLYNFKYQFMPVIAEYGFNTYDYGMIQIFDGKNNFIKIKNQGKDNFFNLCLNEKNKECKYLYHTRSNSITKKDIDENITHIIWKNKEKDNSIIEISKSNGVVINNDNIIFK